MELVIEEIGAQERVPLDQSSEFKDCHFCGELITVLKGISSGSLATHHLNGNRYDNRPENKVLCHFGCHISYHMSRGDRLRPSIMKEEGIREVYGDNIICHFCGESILKLSGRDSDSFLEHHVSYNPEIIVPVHYGCHSSDTFKGKKNPKSGGNKGKDNPMYGREFSLAHRKNLSIARKEVVSSGIICGMKGKHHSEETKEKLRLAALGKKNYWYGTKGPMYGRRHTEEAKEKIRRASVGQKHTEETKEKIREKVKQNWIERKKKYGSTGRREK